MEVISLREHVLPLCTGVSILLHSHPTRSLFLCWNDLFVNLSFTFQKVKREPIASMPSTIEFKDQERDLKVRNTFLGLSFEFILIFNIVI